MSDREPHPDTAAYWRKRTDEELEDALRGGPVGNRSVDGALAEIKRRSSERHELWAKRAFQAALVAAGAAILGAIITAIK